tara:strand:- start:941 stop:1420 length:480 start_codon:yes stop_codon:yes gene_type:complete
MMILALDPASKKTGWCVMLPNGDLQDFGCFSYPNKMELNQRLHNLRFDLCLLMKKHPIETVVIEDLEPRRGANWGVGFYAQAVGVCKAVAWTYMDSPQVYGVGVQTWKGSGRKKDTIQAVNMLYDLALKDDNTADAIGLAVWFQKRMEYNPLPPLAEME